MTASWAPTSTVWSSPTLISSRVPAAGDGISVSTLSVDTSSSGSSKSTRSPTCLSHRVTVPSVTDSPRAGIVTVVPPSLPEPGWGPESTGLSPDAAGWVAGCCDDVSCGLGWSAGGVHGCVWYGCVWYDSAWYSRAWSGCAAYDCAWY